MTHKNSKYNKCLLHLKENEHIFTYFLDVGINKFVIFLKSILFQIVQFKRHLVEMFSEFGPPG